MEEAREEAVPEEEEGEEVELHPLKMMEEAVEGPVETWRRVGEVEVVEELNRDLCWGEEVVHPCRAGRVEEGVELRWGLWRAEVEVELLDLWREEGGEGQSYGAVEEVEVLLWRVEVEVLEKENTTIRYGKC